MCGIAGYSLRPTSPVDRTLAAQALLAGIAHRGADAVGYAWRAPGTVVTVHKQRSGASALLNRIAVAADTTEALLHVRDHTKGHPSLAANNHPVRHGNVVGVHNGTITNDEAVLARIGRGRHAPGMSVDSEAIFALAHVTRSDPMALSQLRGSMASAWVDEREPGTLCVARGCGRPLWLGHAPAGAFFASTRLALELLAETLGLRIENYELEDGVVLDLVGSRVERRQRFRPDRTVARNPGPAVVAPAEGGRCHRLLAQLVAARGGPTADPAVVI